MGGGFFGLPMVLDNAAGMFCAMCLAVLVGALIGIERELHGHPAGMRTHVLVCLGSTVVSLVSAHFPSSGPSHSDGGRIAAQIVSGIGFLGAGAIIRDGLNVRGLTTAASIWTTAGIGIAIGTSAFFAQVAVLATAVVLFTLWLMYPAEQWFMRKAERMRSVEIHFREEGGRVALLMAAVNEQGLEIYASSLGPGPKPDLCRLVLQVRSQQLVNSRAFVSRLASEPGVAYVNIE